MDKIRNFLSYMFGRGYAGRIRRVRVADENSISRTSQEAANLLRQRTIGLVTWFLGGAFCISLIAIIVLTAIGKEPPAILAQILLTSLGYFGGAFASFMGLSD